ncbi:hydroxyacid dehydrogenase [Herbiconiux sp. CPCC 205716]|uniref:Hydroxyacid dehydrogenase n=1 Tax=Herbiconiux gentiana TaxID=2970912 RepID=A0ABT2GJN4_9MICO|nr:hydroxyacid dehydrogenase [Herbiconiux gentiana]MCS5716448.1 hydroxyacid dehydrogenase [Herbiconiux gentiana]
MTRYEIILGSHMLAERLFGTDLKGLDGFPGERRYGVATTVDELRAAGPIDDIEVLLTGWGTPSFTEDDLAALPSLKAIIHAGGVASVLLPPRTTRQLALSVAADINGIPVAEYTLAMILLANKKVFESERLYRRRRDFIDREETYPHAGNFGQTVGIIGASRIGRRLISLLQPFDVAVLVADPYLAQEDAAALGVTATSLEQLLAESDVVSLHAPVTPSTVGMIGVPQLAAMKDGATLINTARGVLMDMPALEAALQTGRIDAILDVTDPDEPLPAGSILWDLPNVILTPHIAGSMGTELQRIGKHVASELARFAEGVPFRAEEPGRA